MKNLREELIAKANSGDLNKLQEAKLIKTLISEQEGQIDMILSHGMSRTSCYLYLRAKWLIPKFISEKQFLYALAKIKRGDA